MSNVANVTQTFVTYVHIIFHFSKKSNVIFHFYFLYMSKQNEHVQRHNNLKRTGKNLFLFLFLKRYQLC